MSRGYKKEDIRLNRFAEPATCRQVNQRKHPKLRRSAFRSTRRRNKKTRSTSSSAKKSKKQQLNAKGVIDPQVPSVSALMPKISPIAVGLGATEITEGQGLEVDP